MKEQIAIQNILRRQFAEIQRANPRYSLRAYSTKVGVHVGALTYIMNGKRNVSRKLAERIVRRLMLEPQERAEVLGLFPKKTPYKKEGAPADDGAGSRYLQLTAAQFKIAGEWEHFAVMSLVRCEDFTSDIAWIARRLGIGETRARQVVDRLIELGLLALDGEGKLARTAVDFRTSDDIADISIKKHHDQTLDLAKESLHRDSVKKRDFTTNTMAIDPSKIGMAKELIRKFQDELSELLESGHRTEVYRLSMQLYPLTKIENE